MRSATALSPAPAAGRRRASATSVLAWLQAHLHQLPTGTELLHPVATYGHKAGEAVVAVFFTLAATWYCVSERDSIIALLTSLAPEAKREKARETYLALDRRLGAYTRLRFLMIFAVGAVLSAGFYAIGLDYWLLVGAFVGLIEIVPLIGPIVGSILVLAVGLPQSLHVAGLSLLWLVVVREFQSYVVNPQDRADGRALAARDAALRLGRRGALRRLRRDPRRAVHLGSRDTDRRARARSRPAGRRSSPARAGPSRRMTPGIWSAADPPQRPVLFVNPRSGGGKATRAGLAERARERGIDAIVLRPDDDLAALVDDAVSRGADALGAAGGDGSLAVVAAAALAHDLPFVCVPAGTRNHFALDAGVDRADLVGSLDAFTDGVERRIDVAEVNGRLFLNNVSLGIYGDAVRQPATATPRRARSRRRPRRCSDRARRQPAWSSWTTAAAPIATPPSCSSRTTPTRSSRRVRPAPARPSTAGSSASSCSTGRPPAGARGEHGRRRSSR